MQLSYWNNKSNNTQKFSISTTGITNTQGTEVTVDVGVSAAFKGLRINVGVSYKMFNTTEVLGNMAVVVRQFSSLDKT